MKKLAIIALIALAGCALSGKHAEKAIKPVVINVDAKAQMTGFIILDPVSTDQQLVYVEVSNQAENAVGVDEALRAAVLEKGYRLTDEPQEAYFMFKMNITEAGNPEGATGYAIVSEVEISQKITSTKKRKIVRSKNFREEDGWRKYTTSALATTNHGNMGFADVEPSLTTALVNKIAEVL
ncbi:MAG: complement resistance protein TraT [Rickettsiaceae bacterium]|jgi:hypothetical protein|nr:complement resistance protein TraT [Rickettsiaceae bacterium]